MKPNPLIDAAASDRSPRGHDNCCKTCGAHVSTYTCNDPLVDLRPEAESEGWDYWKACDNADCEHAYGEGFGPSSFLNPIAWISYLSER